MVGLWDVLQADLWVDWTVALKVVWRVDSRVDD